MMDFKQYGLMVCFLGVLFISSLLKISYGLGGHMCTFSAVAIAGPLLGLALGWLEVAAVIVMYVCLKTFLSGSAFIPFLTTFGLPTLIASYVLGRKYEAISNRALREFVKAFLFIGIPLIGMALFALHPQGQGAMVYTAYWLIPICAYVYEKMKSGSVVATALSSTFLAHVIGSVIYLYSFSIPAHFWLGLIPIVALERVIFAGALGVTLAFVHQSITTSNNSSSISNASS